MATNRKLRQDLLKRLGVSPQALSQRVQRKKAQSPMSTEDATYLIAHEAGIKIDRYLTGEQVDKVRILHGGIRPAVSSPGGNGRARPKASETREIRFPERFRVSGPLLSATKLTEAQKMAGIYPVLYVLENSIREVIKRVMAARFGSDWWDTQLTTGKLKGVHKTASDRMKTEATRLRWHQTRGAHPIDYVDLGHLGDIILGKQDQFFPDVLGDDREWFIQFMKELEPSRNVVCHMNPLSKHNIEDVKLRLKRWHVLINSVSSHVPASAS